MFENSNATEEKPIKVFVLSLPHSKEDRNTLMHFFTWHAHMASDNPKSLPHLLVLYMCQVLLFSLFTDIL